MCVCPEACKQRQIILMGIQNNESEQQKRYFSATMLAYCLCVFVPAEWHQILCCCNKILSGFAHVFCVWAKFLRRFESKFRIFSSARMLLLVICECLSRRRMDEFYSSNRKKDCRFFAWKLAEPVRFKHWECSAICNTEFYFASSWAEWVENEFKRFDKYWH